MGRLAALFEAVEWVIEVHHGGRAGGVPEEGRKRYHCRLSDAVLELSRAFALSAANEEVCDIPDEVGYLPAARATLVKSAPVTGKSSAEQDLAVQMIVGRAMILTEVVDTYTVTGLKAPDASILSDEFLAEVTGMERKNIAAEAPSELINGKIHSRSRVDVVQPRTLSDRLREANARYHNNAITTSEEMRARSPPPRFPVCSTFLRRCPLCRD